MKKNPDAQRLANLRHLSLSPERRKEISQKASKRSAEVRRIKKLSPTKHLTDK